MRTATGVVSHDKQSEPQVAKSCPHPLRPSQPQKTHPRTFQHTKAHTSKISPAPPPPTRLSTTSMRQPSHSLNPLFTSLTRSILAFASSSLATRKASSSNPSSPSKRSKLSLPPPLPPPPPVKALKPLLRTLEKDEGARLWRLGAAGGPLDRSTSSNFPEGDFGLESESAVERVRRLSRQMPRRRSEVSSSRARTFLSRRVRSSSSSSSTPSSSAAPLASLFLQRSFSSRRRRFSFSRAASFRLVSAASFSSLSRSRSPAWRLASASLWRVVRAASFFSRVSTLFKESEALFLWSSASRSRLLVLVSTEMRSEPSLTAFSLARSRLFFTSASSRCADPAARSARMTFSSRAETCSL